MATSKLDFWEVQPSIKLTTNERSVRLPMQEFWRMFGPCEGWRRSRTYSKPQIQLWLPLVTNSAKRRNLYFSLSVACRHFRASRRSIGHERLWCMDSPVLLRVGTPLAEVLAEPCPGCRMFLEPPLALRKTTATHRPADTVSPTSLRTIARESPGLRCRNF